MRGRAVVGAAFAAVVLAACGSARDAEVRTAATAFAAAVADGDGAAACAALTPEARRGVQSFGRDCAATIVQLPPAGIVEAVQVWGDSAQVRFAGDVVFLAELGDEWRVRAAGCRARPGAPYECAVEG
ncbi:hypothetical protein SAMN05443637_107151 [Pseudonocardia thermophila]|jgi:hypothetical protein|uniref:Lipoprotein n=1 Tax=Pseudonocardia thermophila TaxID=1848 RepID=A0A1M6T4R9_PSETH|nr:hypothetical protein [Pseudonocardia thermophila]SHK51914.1 hypothetical protein SAMN05443637_107151 [Pseudonocardia thermophila]